MTAWMTACLHGIHFVELVFSPIPVPKLWVGNRAIRSDWRASEVSPSWSLRTRGVLVPAGWAECLPFPSHNSLAHRRLSHLSRNLLPDCLARIFVSANATIGIYVTVAIVVIVRVVIYLDSMDSATKLEVLSCLQDRIAFSR